MALSLFSKTILTGIGIATGITAWAGIKNNLEVYGKAFPNEIEKAQIKKQMSQKDFIYKLTKLFEKEQLTSEQKAALGIVGILQDKRIPPQKKALLLDAIVQMQKSSIEAYAKRIAKYEKYKRDKELKRQKAIKTIITKADELYTNVLVKVADVVK